MFQSIALALVMTIFTIAVHATFMIITMKANAGLRSRVPNLTPWERLRMVGTPVLLMSLASFIEVGLWAGAYLAVGAITGVEPAVYFSMVTFTTLGYGDVVLEPGWRLLAALEAVNGIIIFGWTTAIVVSVVQRAYFSGRD